MILNFVGEGDFFIGGTVVYAFYTSLTGGNHVGTKEEYASYKAGYTKQASDIRESVRVLREKLTEVLENRSERNRWISQFTQFFTLETLDRRALIHKAIFDADALTTELSELLIDRVLVYSDKRIEIAYKIRDIFD
ncbi:hypothetical protein [Agathobaculum sp.]|uniref:hypothetical protein n=1 Tax=Agathobaculum sp. TaxID=2048138 RepID=UPI003AB5B6EF